MSKGTVTLRNVSHVRPNGTIIPVNNRKGEQGKTALRHTGNEQIFQGQNQVIVHKTSKIVKHTILKAGLNKCM